MNLLAIIPLTSATQPQPAAQAQAANSTQQQASQAEDVNAASTPRSNQPAAASDKGNTDSNDKNFSKLLSSSQKSPAPQAAAATTNTLPVQDDTSSDDAATNENATDQVSALMVLFLQLQQVTPQPVKASDNVADAIGAPSDAKKDCKPPATLDDLIAQITDLLQQALKALSAATPPATAQGSADTEMQADASAADTTTQDSSQTASASDLLALILSLLPQQTAPGQNMQAPQTAAQPQDTLTIGDNSSSSTSSPVQQLTTALNQLADLLEKAQPETAAAFTAPQPAATEETAAPAAIPSLPDAAPAPKAADASRPPTDTQTATAVVTPQPVQPLQQAIARLADALGHLAPAAPKQDDDSDTASQPVTAAAQAPSQPTPHTDFIRQVSQPSSAPHIPVVDQVVVQVKNAINDGTSQIRIQLHPADLGKVDVQMSTNVEGKTSITITSDNRNTLALLQSDAKALQDALRDIGLKTDAGGLNFNLRDPGQDARNSGKQAKGSYTQVAAIDEDDDYGFSTAGSLYRIAVQQGLDIRV